MNALGSHARLGRGELLVAEADESDGSFLRLSPTIIAVTNLDREHLDHYGSMERIYESFLEFINKVPFYGLAVLCADDQRLRGLFPNIVKRYYTYGLSESDGVTPDFRATDIVAKQGGSEFRAFFRTRNLGPFRLAVPGIHNVSNALAAIAIGVELDVPVDLIRKALAAFTGVERRFHIRGESNGVMVVDDYGHLLAGSWWSEADIDVSENTAHSFGGDRRLGHEWDCRGVADSRLQSDRLRSTGLRYHQAVGGIGRPDLYRPSRIPDRGGSGCGDFVRRFAAKPGGDGG